MRFNLKFNGFSSPQTSIYTSTHLHTLGVYLFISVRAYTGCEARRGFKRELQLPLNVQAKPNRLALLRCISCIYLMAFAKT